MSATRVKTFDLDNDTSENIFSHPILAIWRMKDYKERNNKYYLLEMSPSHAKMLLKRAPQNLNITMAKAISISYNLDCSSKCPCTFPQSYVWSHSLVFEKSHFKTSNILFRKNYWKLEKINARFRKNIKKKR